MKKIYTPLRQETICELKAGDEVYLTGIIYTARDMAHKRLIEIIKNNEKIPFELLGSVIYYAGPTPVRPGEIAGSVGPTTSERMDIYTPKLLEFGLKGMIGKGNRSDEVIESIVKNKAVYFTAIGGAAALLSKSIKSLQLYCWKDLGPEAIYKLYVEDFPLIVAIDSEGNNLYEIGPKRYSKIKL